jgi:hypothetical protein
MLMAKKEEKGNESTPTLLSPARARAHVRLVPSLPPGADFSRLISHSGQTLKSDPSSPASLLSSDPFSALLIPTSDLTTLLSDPSLRRRYREGRYVQGKNVSLKMAAWPTCLAVTTNAITARCEPALGIGVVVALALHIGLRYIASWESTQQLQEVQETFNHESPGFSAVTVHSVKHILDRLQPLPIGGPSRTVVISESLSDELTVTAGALGMGSSALAPYCCMVTFISQPKKMVNKHLRGEMEGRVDELRKWLRWKARTIEAAIEEFDTPET